ncbi:MAG: methyltransferase [Chthoniobacteraceae bacterium]|nr:methyltransferase [Chthoniobacteraceae bacterium]
MAGMTACILILYTTLYREGGAEFELAACELERARRAEFPTMPVIRKAVESKKDFMSEINSVAGQSMRISELHFIGHSGMYGIMFGTTSWPEQFSPFEWKNMSIPFAADGKAYFHACRTGRWFAPFFARVFQVKAYGYFWYTTVSTQADRFAWRGVRAHGNPIHIISVPGKKSHGLIGSIKKYLFRPDSYPMLEFVPVKEEIDTTYDGVASLYDETFEDISVRADELRWLRRQLSKTCNPRLLDIGSGTGSFLRAIEDLVDRADGVDLSAGMVAQARKRSIEGGKLNFTTIDGPRLPFADESFDVVTSILSFRYLDWDPIIAEVLRVLKPGGRLFIIDMVAAPVKWRHWPRLLIDKLRQSLMQRKHPHYRQALRKMVSDPRWKKMLEYNPIRAEHEMKWYLQSRFPGGQLQVINYGWNSRVLAFASPPLHEKKVAALSFP